MKKLGGGSAGCLALFILPFAAVGTFMFYLILSDLIGWFRMQTWKEVPATIRSAELKISPGSKSSTYSTLAEFEYSYDGRQYKSSRVSRYGGNDNIGSFHQDTYSELSAYRDSKKSFRCYVNPNAPEEAILYRQVRLPMLCFYGAFAGAFGGIGYGVLLGLIVSIVDSRRRAALEKLYPAQPWKARADWSRNEARTSAGFKMFISIASAIFVGAISLPVLIFLSGELLKGNYFALIALIFPLIAAGLITWAVRSTLQWKRFGSAVLQLTNNPVRPGERLRGVIQTGSNLPQSAAISLELKCERTVRRRSGNKTSISTETEWSHKMMAMSTPGTDGKTCVQVDVEIPEQLPSTGKESENSDIDWVLHAKADIPGIDLNAKFNIPVFRIV
jgi:hypothetical protein